MFKKFMVLIVSICMLVSIYGCATILVATAGGAGTAFWLSGKLSETLDAPYDRTVKASKEALKSLNLKITKETEKETVSQLMSEYTDGATIWVDIRPVTKEKSKVEVRVGMRGNKEASTKILEAIKRRL